MRILKKLAKYFAGLGGGLFGLAIFMFVSNAQLRTVYENNQKEYNKGIDDAMLMAGQITMIVSSIMFLLVFIFLISYLLTRMQKQINMEAVPDRKKYCTNCGTKLMYYTICPICGYKVEPI
jgi:Zn finger protein HypA/HybF involved in hydrogenase expression